MRRFWADRHCLKGPHFVLAGDLFHHVVRVCRIRKGERFELLCQGLQKYQVQLDSVRSSNALALIEKTYPVPPLPKPELHLALSLPHLRIADKILASAVELGIRAFHPFVSEFSFFKNADSVSGKKIQRWQSIANQAQAQSLRTEPLEICPVRDFKNLSLPENTPCWMAYENLPGSFGLNEKDKDTTLNSLKEVWLFIGSEGGFSESEAQLFCSKGGRLFSLGEQILRVETACLTGLALLKYRYHRSFDVQNPKSPAFPDSK